MDMREDGELSEESDIKHYLISAVDRKQLLFRFMIKSFLDNPLLRQRWQRVDLTGNGITKTGNGFRSVR